MPYSRYSDTNGVDKQLAAWGHTYLPVPRIHASAIAKVQCEFQIGADIPGDSYVDSTAPWRRGRA